MHSMPYVKAVYTKHIHSFLPITFLIFNRFSTQKKFWKAETKGFQPYHQILCMLTLGVSISYAFNGIYIEAVDKFSTQCKFCKIQFMSTLSIYAASCMQQHKEPQQKFSLYMLTLLTNNISYTIHNSIALIFCIAKACTVIIKDRSIIPLRIHHCI